METYIIKCDIEKEIEAENEEEAIRLFYDELALENDFLDNHIKIMKKNEIKKRIKKRLEYLRKEIENERISYEEIAELQSLAKYIDNDDVLLLEWAGVKEFNN